MMSRIDFLPSPLSMHPAVDDETSLNGLSFELQLLPRGKNNMFEAAANGQIDDIKTYFSTMAKKVDTLDQNGASALHHAAKMNRVEVIDFMLKAGADVDVYSTEGLTPLHVAARSNALEALDMLLKKGAKPNVATRPRGCTPLHIATQFGNRQIIERLLNVKCLEIDATDGQEMTALHIAISREYEDICKDLIHSGASISMSTKEGHTCLHLAANAGNTDIVSLVIQTALANISNYPGYAMRPTRDVPEFDQFVNQTNGDKNTALHIAVQTGHVSMCQVLLQQGADLNMQNKCLKTPLHVASIGRNKEIMELLIKRGAQLSTKDRKQRTPLHSAASFGNQEGIDLLLKSLASKDPTDADGMTPFLCAVAAGHTMCAKLLLEYGADITPRDKYQRCCVHLAVENDKEEVLKMLLERPGLGLTNVPDIHERTPLHYAALSTNIRLLNIILEKKANCLLTNDAGKTALHIAAETGKTRHVEALVRNSFACVGQKDPDGRTPLHLAALNGNGKICSILLRMGAQVESTDVHGCTPLLLAAKAGTAGLIRMLLEVNANIDHQEKTGNTALLIASTKGHVDVVKMLLDRQASLKPDDNGLNCLDVAIGNQQGDVVTAIIKNSRWREVLSAKSPDGHNRMGKLIQMFPDAAKSVLDRCIQRSLAERSITYDFSLLDPGPDDKSGPNGKPFFGLNVIVEHKQKDLLVHDVCRKLLKIKWRVYGWFVYWTNLVFYFSFLALMTYFMLTQRGNVVLKRRNSYVDDDYEDIFDMEKDVFGHITEYLILIFAFIHLLKELYQIAVERTMYFKQVTNLLEWVLYLSTILFILPYVFPSLSYLRVNPNFTWQMGTVAVFLGYMNLILFVQTLDYVGIYVTMFYQVAITVIKAISIFLLFAVAFSVVFFILFREQDAFDTFFLTLMKVIVMTVGEIDYTSMVVDNLNATNTKSGAPLVPYQESSFFFLTLFIFAMPIILMNLLVGLAVGDIESVQRYAYLRNKGKFVDFLCGVERNYPKFITRRFYKPQLVVTGRYVEKKISSQEFAFDDQDLANEDYTTVNEDEQRLEMLAKELAKATKRQLSIIDTIQDQKNLLLAVAAKAGVDTREQATRSFSRV